MTTDASPSDPREKTSGAPDGSRTRVFLANDHVALRGALAATIAGRPELELVEAQAEGTTGVEALRGLPDGVIDVVLIDIPPHEDVEAHARAYLEAADGVRLVGYAGSGAVRAAMLAAGVHSVVLKDEGPGTLIAELKRVAG